MRQDQQIQGCNIDRLETLALVLVRPDRYVLRARRERPRHCRAAQIADQISTSEWTAQHLVLHVAGRDHHHRITQAGTRPWMILKCSESLEEGRQKRQGSE